MLHDKGLNCLKKCFCAQLFCKSKIATWNRRHWNWFTLEFVRCLKCVEHCRMKQVNIYLLIDSVVPNRTHSMNHIFALEIASTCKATGANCNSAILVYIIKAFFLNCGPSIFLNCARDIIFVFELQILIGTINNSISSLRC